MTKVVPRYDFRCPHGHVTELVCGMADVPASIRCTGTHGALALLDGEMPAEGVGAPVPGRNAYACVAAAARVFQSPAAIHFKGSGFYSTDVKGRLERRRRKMPADDMPRGDSDSHALARRW